MSIIKALTFFFPHSGILEAGMLNVKDKPQKRLLFQLVQSQFTEFLYETCRKYLSTMTGYNDICNTYAFFPSFLTNLVFMTFNTNWGVLSFHTIRKKKFYRCNSLKFKVQKCWTLFFLINLKAKISIHWGFFYICYKKNIFYWYPLRGCTVISFPAYCFP